MYISVYNSIKQMDFGVKCMRAEHFEKRGKL